MSQPNILFIMADQMSAKALPMYGHAVVRTPTLSKLASKGVVFENAYCNSRLCDPSRLSMMSGLLPHKIGAYDNAPEFPASTPTFAHYLWLKGYLPPVGACRQVDRGGRGRGAPRRAGRRRTLVTTRLPGSPSGEQRRESFKRRGHGGIRRRLTRRRADGNHDTNAQNCDRVGCRQHRRALGESRCAPPNRLSKPTARRSFVLLDEPHREHLWCATASSLRCACTNRRCTCWSSDLASLRLRQTNAALAGLPIAGHLAARDAGHEAARTDGGAEPADAPTVLSVGSPLSALTALPAICALATSIEHQEPKRPQENNMTPGKAIRIAVGLSILSCTVPTTANEHADERHMGFFVTSVGVGRGGDLGGLEGADAHCQKLATAAGAGDREWRAYLSTEESDKRGVFARHRIGTGPWYNAHGVLIATNVTDLHLHNRTIALQTALDENGNRIKGRYDERNEHDILTGTQDDGTAFFPDEQDHTCSNWTSSGDGSAQVGHHDRHGGGNTSWNSAHPSRGCSQEALRGTGGNGYFYCFAAD